MMKTTKLLESGMEEDVVLQPLRHLEEELNREKRLKGPRMEWEEQIRIIHYHQWEINHRKIGPMQKIT